MQELYVSVELHHFAQFSDNRTRLHDVVKTTRLMRLQCWAIESEYGVDSSTMPVGNFPVGS